jgi:hypothetical protein
MPLRMEDNPVFAQRSELMNLNTAVVQGALKDDGTLELDEKPPLAPGRVQVTILPIPPKFGDRRTHDSRRDRSLRLWRTAVDFALRKG